MYNSDYHFLFQACINPKQYHDEPLAPWLACVRTTYQPQTQSAGTKVCNTLFRSRHKHRERFLVPIQMK